MSSGPDELELDPFSWAFHENPFPVYARLRAEAPAYHNPRLGFWALSRHADVAPAFRDWELYSSAKGIALEHEGEASASASFLAMDPPRHDQLRGLVSRAFTPRRVADLEPRIRELARSYLRPLAERGGGDFIEDFAGRLPMDVVSELLGVPVEQRADLRTWSDTVLHRPEGVVGIPPEARVASGQMVVCFIDIVKERRRRPGLDLISALLATEVEGERLGDGEILGFLFLMIIAGNETTTKLLANALYWAWRNRAQRKLVEADPTLVARWVEETMRYDNSTQIMYRTLTRDHEIHGQRMREGEKVALLIGSANRDERVFPDADRYDILRDTRESLAFGVGIHFCLGASLARLEGRVALEEVLLHLPHWSINENNLERVHSPNVRGFSKMPLHLDHPIRAGRLVSPAE